MGDEQYYGTENLRNEDSRGHNIVRTEQFGGTRPKNEASGPQTVDHSPRILSKRGSEATILRNMSVNHRFEKKNKMKRRENTEE